METKLLSSIQIDEIAALLQDGQVVAFPTDTVFGLAVRYDSEDAMNRLKEAKVRPDSKPLPMMVSNKNQIQLVAQINEQAQIIIDKWMPGALTIVLRKHESVPDFVTNGEETIAIRMADDEFVIRLIEKVGVPLLVTSANISGQSAATSSKETLEQLGGRIDAVVEGDSKGGRASTILDLTEETIKVLREGPITIDRVLYSIKEAREHEDRNRE